MDEYCPRHQSIINCVQEFSNITNICLLPNEIELKDIFVRIVNNFTIYTCKDNGAHLIEILTEENRNCFAEIKPDVKTQCNPIINNNKRKSFFENTQITSDDCSTLESFEQCYLTNLNRCPSNKPAKIFKELIDIVWSELPCYNLESDRIEVALS